MDLFANAITEKFRLDGPEWQMDLGKPNDGAAADSGEARETFIYTVPYGQKMVFLLTKLFLIMTVPLSAIIRTWREPEMPV